jgi:hypothetical protein
MSKRSKRATSPSRNDREAGTQRYAWAVAPLMLLCACGQGSDGDPGTRGEDDTPASVADRDASGSSRAGGDAGAAGAPHDGGGEGGRSESGVVNGDGGALRCTGGAASPTFFVAPTGDDGNAGTADKPWKTLQHAADVAKPGDVVRAVAGVHVGRVVLSRSGTAEAPITFEGERSADCAWPTTLDGSEPVASGAWVPAPEVGAMVFKTTSIAFVPESLAVVEGSTYRHVPRLHVSEFLPNPLEALTIPADGVFDSSCCFLADQSTIRVPAWDGLDGFFYYADGTTYVRFRDGDDPNTKTLRAAPDGPAVDVNGQSHFVLRNFAVRGAQDGVWVHDAVDGTVLEGNSIAVNGRAIYLFSGPTHTLIRDSDITHVRLSKKELPGAWDLYDPTQPLSAHPEATDLATKDLVYNTYKYQVGRSDVMQQGITAYDYAFAEIANNFIHDIGSPIYVRPHDLEVHHNTIARADNSCLAIGTGENLRLHDNLVMDCNTRLRIWNPQDEPVNVGGFIYNNRFWNPARRGGGGAFYVSPSGPVTAQLPHEFFVYHNSYAGGWEPLTLIPGFKLEGSRFVNNVFSPSTMILNRWGASGDVNGDPSYFALFDYNWLGTDVVDEAQWYGPHTLIANGQWMWNDDTRTTVPDFTLPADSSARAAGIDLSQPWTAGGKTYPSLPGMSPGYAGPTGKPDLGAL